MTSSIALIIFDFDGLILDTETPEFEAWQEFYAQYGVSLSLDAWADCIGQRAGVFDPVGHLEELLGCAVAADLRERHRERFHKLVHAEPLRPGILQYLDDADRLGVTLAVASSASRDWVYGHLQRHGIDHRFACILTVEDVTHAKPHPELFLRVLERLNVPAHRSVVLEDSPNGLLAANRAGIFAVAVPNSVTAPLPMGHADLVIPSLAEVPLEVLIHRINALRDAPTNRTA